ncbi:MAG: uridine kinase [Acidobacteriota bacterium]|nr:uridine kinase [Acidobacteriota bacterium]
MKPRITIGVGGGTGSGKTTLSLKLAEFLGPERVLILSQDHYYRDAGHLPVEQRALRNFDRPEAVDFELLVRHLKQLQAGLEIDRPRYDFTRHVRLEGSEPAPPRPVILVEGTLVFAAEELVGCLDLKLFVDADPDIRFIRRLRRDIRERGRSVESIVHQYLETVRPMHLRFVEPARTQADLVISGVDGIEQQLAQVGDRIKIAAGI